MNKYTDNDKKLLESAYKDSPLWKSKCNQKKKEVDYTCEVCGRVTIDNYIIRVKNKKHFMHEDTSDLQFICNDCLRIEKLKNKKQSSKGKKKNSKKNKSTNNCSNCYFSYHVSYTKGGKRNHLWCNKNNAPCHGVCAGFKRDTTK